MDIGDGTEKFIQTAFKIRPDVIDNLWDSYRFWLITGSTEKN